ncbi:SDR family NAD(P)-dependent oxidoreductase [Sphingobacterium sp. HJSM2_6]|uniref:SDR family NAD(P)-dependent oxidoreductase n=1 Tax=Sphingobacterium sp. HJSM2_6 TaxID=3366264 RepID=UPI003BBA1126
MEKIFKDQVVIISGGMGDIGYATAMRFAVQGANIAIGDVLEEQSAIVQEKTKALSSLGVHVHYQQVDVRSSEQVREWLNQVEQQLSIPQIIICNAAIASLKSLYQLSPEDWENEMQVNLNGSFFLSQMATESMLNKNLGGYVVFVNSWASTNVHLHMPAYSVSKAALTMLCKCMALELAPKNIIVNSIAPGYVDAGLTGKFWQEKPELKDKARERVPTRTVISAEEVADQIVYLSHPTNKHITGTTLLMDGGLSIK